ncbi:Mrp/NBP35 family ATP-binding protein [Methylovirgula sp. HY1]|uniref:Mrp/NBP35 family ATP-binding protein n=1 Tax=Methylovirgula sp. HY1 TaxID=2822761 RepID=UPI001C5AF987|nr:Mrp/NBP35 family ATP-binding protein [Methylovirgula sp. HY1]QXX73300.1 Iron-sulfur cluster carrier protein [Methylovirgula sp. HY1]
MLTNDDVLTVLASVAGPDGRTPLSQSGAISGISIKDDQVFVAIAVAPDEAATLESMRMEAEVAIRAMPGVGSALVILTAETERQNGHGHGHGHGHAPNGGGGHQNNAPPQSNGIPGIKQIIAVASGKGGVGKSTTACNLALGLSRLGLKIGLLDADLFGPSVPRLFGLNAKPELAADGKSLAPLEKYGVKIMSIGFLAEEGAAIVWRGPMVMSALTQLLREVAWGELDVLVVDMPPGTGDAQLTMAQTVPLAGAVIVSTPQDLALIDARRGVAMFQQVRIPLLGIVENMSYFLCPHCGTRSDIFAHGGARLEAERLGVAFLGEVPLDMAIRETSDDGRPVVVSAPESAHAAAYMAIAERVLASLQESASQTRRTPKIVMG